MAEKQIPWTQLKAAQRHFVHILTKAQAREISGITRVYRMNWGVDWNPKENCIALRAYNRQNQPDLSVPFDENSTTEDVEKFIDLLKVMDVHDG